MQKQDIRKMREEYFKKYPDDKVEFDSGIVSSKIVKRVNKFIGRYAANRPGTPSGSTEGGQRS